MKQKNAKGIAISQVSGLRKTTQGEEGPLIKRLSLFRQFRNSGNDGEKKAQQRLRPKGYCVQLMIALMTFTSPFFNYTLAQPAEAMEAFGVERMEPLMVGLTVPDEFWTTKHLFYIDGDTIRKDLTEYKGKLLVLDFWSTSCASCIAHREEISYFTDKYSDHLAVVMVNPKKTNDDLSRIRAFDKRFYVPDTNSFLETIIEDKILQELFKFSGYPHYVWINRYGYIQTTTFRNLLDRGYVAPFIDENP